ncbi:Uncharacterised protein [uncultured archaeon]|nr:Uncharacterised protein [uncultured archaeon]
MNKAEEIYSEFKQSYETEDFSRMHELIAKNSGLAEHLSQNEIESIINNIRSRT